LSGKNKKLNKLIITISIKPKKLTMWFKKNYNLLLLSVLCYSSIHAQTGIGTATPNSMLDVRGSVSLNYRAFTSNTTITSADNVLVFTGTSATTITLPTAAGCTGRRYTIKNAATTPSLLTVATTPAETIDGMLYWILDEANEAVEVSSNGSNWLVRSQNVPGSSGVNWTQNGNLVSAPRYVGTTTNFDLPFITNNTEKMRLMSTGQLAVGTSALDATNPEKLLVDAGTTTSYNVISGKGSLNNYLQLNIQNRSSGNSASSDVVATADNGNETVNFIDMGINSSSFSNNTLAVLDGANNAYLYNAGNDFVIGNATTNKNLVLFTGGYNTLNERWKITGDGNTGIGATAPTEKLQTEGNIRLSGADKSIFFDSYYDPYAGIKSFTRTGEVNELMLFSGNDITGSYGADRIRLASQEIHFATAPARGSVNSGDPSSYYANTTNVPTRMFINSNGNVGIGSTTFNNTNPEALLVNAGNTSSYNVISGKGSYNNYLQLNIQNSSTGTNASSDIVATADNGNETTNFVNMGINSSTYAGTGITSGANNAYLYSTGNDFVIGNGTNSKNLIFYTTNGSGTSAQIMSITSAGLIPGANNTYTLGNSSKRNTAVWSVNGTIQTSDMRLKKNIRKLGYGLKELLQLNTISYNWIDDKSNRPCIGLMAQQVKKVIPEIVIGNEEKETLGVNYGELIPVLITALQELKQKTELLKLKAKQLNLIARQ
jgi:Chaperone of endosialidase